MFWSLIKFFPGFCVTFLKNLLWRIKWERKNRKTESKITKTLQKKQSWLKFFYDLITAANIYGFLSAFFFSFSKEASFHILRFLNMLFKCIYEFLIFFKSWHNLIRSTGSSILLLNVINISKKNHKLIVHVLWKFWSPCSLNILSTIWNNWFGLRYLHVLFIRQIELKIYFISMLSE